jgi:PAS domain S-box-containing protein
MPLESSHPPSEKALDANASGPRLRALIRIGLELASERDIERVFQRVCEAARELFGATYVTLGIVDVEERTVQRVVTSGTDAATWIKAGDAVPGILETVVDTRRALRGENSGGDPSGLQLPALHPEVRAFLAAPITSPTHAYGWFCVVENGGRTFTEEDQDLLSAFSGQIGRIYENSHFRAAARQRSEELEHEILERKQAEADLRGERDRSQRYLDAATVILLAIDMDGRITLVNRYACSVLGWTAEELLGRDWIQTCLPVRIRDALRQRRDDLVGGDLSIIENPILTRTGEERLIEWHNTLLRDDAGHIIGTLSSGADITERKRAVEALRTAEERMRFALQNANVGIWDIDYTTGVNRWSETIEAHYGLLPGTFGGTFEAFVACIHPDDRESVLDVVGKAMRSGDDFTVHNRSIWPDGTVRWLTGIGRIHLGEHGEPVRGVGISLDVTEHRMSEEQYQQSQKMQAIGTLAGGIAHDFNNILAVIGGYTELLKASFAHDAATIDNLDAVESATARAATLVQQILTFSRHEETRREPLQLGPVIEEAVRSLRSTIPTSIEIQADLSAATPTVLADAADVHQIVMNLGANAWHAMRDSRGRLDVILESFDVDRDLAELNPRLHPGSYARLSVSDTGLGMAPATLGRIFEPFFTTHPVGQGSGLGLAVVHGIMQSHEGAISVYSNPGQGSVFRLYFPAHAHAESALDSSSAALMPGHEERIL